MNTIALGLMALMRFESKSSLHTQGACTLQSLKVCSTYYGYYTYYGY